MAVLKKIRDSLAPTGSYLMVEPRMDHHLTNNRTSFGKLLYGMSCLHCAAAVLVARRARFGRLLGAAARAGAGHRSGVFALHRAAGAQPGDGLLRVKEIG